MTSSVQLSLGKEITQKLSNNSALRDSVAELGQQFEQMFSAKLNELIQQYAASEEGNKPATDAASPASRTGPVAQPAAGLSTADFVSRTASATAPLATAELVTNFNASTSPAAAPAGTAAAWSPPWMATADTGAGFMHATPEAAASALDSKPTVADFMKATGANFETASSLLYGVVGANTDQRDWQKIMASSDPIMAARNATGSMYSSQNSSLVKNDDYQIPADQIKAKTENFTWSQVNNRDHLWLTDAEGNQLRELRLNTPEILKNLQDFGMNPQQLTNLADQLDQKQINYKPGTLYPNSDAGVDLKALGQGNLLASMAYDWRVGNNLDFAKSIGAA